jgi:hypothetical protein
LLSIFTVATAVSQVFFCFRWFVEFMVRMEVAGWVEAAVEMRHWRMVVTVCVLREGQGDVGKGGIMLNRGVFGWKDMRLKLMIVYFTTQII